MRKVNLRILILILVAVLLNTLSVMSSPLDPECSPPTAVALLKVESEGKPSLVWLTVIVLSIVALALAVAKDLREIRRLKSRIQALREMREELTLWNAEMKGRIDGQEE